MHYWQNPSILKCNTPNMGSVRANRPKGLKDEEWAAILGDEKLNRLISLNAVPKASKREEKQKS